MRYTTGLDFGTTNSTIGYNDGKKSELIELGKLKNETRTVLFWNNEDKKFTIGDEGISEFVDGYEGRLLQSVKSFLNSTVEVKTYLGRKNRDISEICSIIIKSFKDKLEAIIGEESESILIGRPVKFHDTDYELDKKAQAKLYEAVKLAGYKYIEFEFEPIGAVISYKERCEKEENILVVDLGGGTSDFSVVNINPKIEGTKGINILANNGVYIGGDKLDYELSMNFFSHFLGRGTKYKSFDKILEVGDSPFSTLSDWKNINKLLDRKTVSHIKSYYNGSLNRDSFGRLLEIINDISIGYDYYNLIRSTKEKLSSTNKVQGITDFFKNNFNFILSIEQFEGIIQEKVNNIKDKLEETIKMSGLQLNEIDKVLMTGGTSLIPIIRQIVEELVGKGKIVKGNEFSTVGYGLTLESFNRFG